LFDDGLGAAAVDLLAESARIVGGAELFDSAGKDEIGLHGLAGGERF